MCHIWGDFYEPWCFEPALSHLRTPISLAASAAWDSHYVPSLCSECSNVRLSNWRKRLAGTGGALSAADDSTVKPTRAIPFQSAFTFFNTAKPYSTADDTTCTFSLR
jgi:hypothetical protein